MVQLEYQKQYAHSMLYFKCIIDVFFVQIQIRQQNFMGCVHSIVVAELFTIKDNMLQLASCSYDVHVQEIIGGLVVGASIVMLHPQGNMDFEYVMKVMKEKQISYMQSVPAYLHNLLDFLPKKNPLDFGTLSSLDIGGKQFVLFIRSILLVFSRRDEHS